MKKIIKVLLIIIAVVGLTYLFIAHPYQISGGNPGPYKSGEMVIAMSATLYKSVNAIKPGNVVIIQVRNMDDVAQVVGIPGDASAGGMYLSGEKLVGVVPAGFYVVSFNNSDKQTVIPESQISKVVWAKLF